VDAYIYWSGYQYLLSGMVGIVLLLLQLSGAIILIKQRTEEDIAKSYPLLVWDIVLGWYYLRKLWYISYPGIKYRAALFLGG